MLFGHLGQIVFPSAGSLSVAVVAAFIFILQIWFSTKRAEFRWYLWAAAASFATILYAIGIFLEYNAPEGSINRFGGLLEWTAVIFLVHILYGFVFARLKLPARRYHSIAGALHVLILILLWSTHLFVSDHFVRRPFFFLGRPFVETDLGPLGPVFMLYALGASINAIRIWIVKGKERGTLFRAFVWGVSFWILLGAHDAGAAIGLPSFQYVMEYGFLAFSAALLCTMFNDYIQASESLKRSNLILQKELEARKRTEAALRESEKRLRIAQRMANIGNWSWDMASGRAEWSDQVYEIFKAPRKKLSYEFAKSFVHPDDLDLWQSTVQEAVEEQKPFFLDYRAIRSDGETIWVHNDTQAVFNEQGKLTGYEGTVQDITERKQAVDRIDQRNKELGVINKVIGSVSSTLDLDEVLELALDGILQIAGLETGSIYLMEHHANELVLAGYRGASEEFVKNVRTFKLGESFTGHVALTGEPVVADDITKDSRVTTSLVSEECIRSFAAIPIKSKGKMQGVICMGSRRPYSFSDEAIRLYTSIANYISVAIENARIYEERQSAMEALKTSEELHKEAQRVAHIGHWELDPDIGTPVWSDEIFRIFGLDPREGEPSFTEHETHVHPEDWPILDKAVRRAGMDGTPFDLVFRVMKPDGEIGWMHAIGTTSMDDEGNVTKLFGTAQDITVLRKAEEALRESEEKYRSLVESTEDSIYLVDRNCMYMFMNKKHLSRFGIKKDEVMGERYGDFHSKEETKEFEGRVTQVIETDKSHWYVYESKRDGGYYLRTLSPVKDLKGNIVAVTVVSKDITELKRAEEALMQTNEALSKAHKQRKILSKRLIDLLEKDRRQIAMELHDHIGQTLTSLKMEIEMIHGKLSPEHTELEDRITAAQERASQALKDVKNISCGLRPAMIDALGLVPSLRELFNEIQRQMGMEIQFFSRNFPKRFTPDKEVAIYRIAQEALNNIVKHARAKNVFVNLVEKDGKLLFTIEDDGVGFDQYKVMKPTGKKLPLGLLIMRERVEQLDGEFTLESRIGKGTHLLVEIPL